MTWDPQQQINPPNLLEEAIEEEESFDALELSDEEIKDASEDESKEGSEDEPEKDQDSDTLKDETRGKSEQISESDEAEVEKNDKMDTSDDEQPNPIETSEEESGDEELPCEDIDIFRFKNYFFGLLFMKMFKSDDESPKYLVVDSGTLNVSKCIVDYGLETCTRIFFEENQESLESRFDIPSKNIIKEKSLSRFIIDNRENKYSGIFLERKSLSEIQDDLHVLFTVDAFDTRCDLAILINPEDESYEVFSSEFHKEVKELLKRFSLAKKKLVYYQHSSCVDDESNFYFLRIGVRDQ